MTTAILERPATEALPTPFANRPDPRGVVPTPATRALVASQVGAVLAAAPSFHELSPDDQRELTGHMQHIASYAAELVRDDWCQSARLDQRPVLKQTTTLRPARAMASAQAAGDNLGAGATSRVGDVTRQTLRAIAFPEFVADLIRSTFRAIMDASIQQLDAIRALLGNVSSTVDEFEESNITDSQAREWLAQQYGTHLKLTGGHLTSRQDAPETPPQWQQQLGLPRDVDISDEDAIEEVLVPAARRKLSQGRLETLSLLVLMGTERIVVTGGKIRATMAFHIDASDAAREANASEFDMRVTAAGSVGFGPWSASVSTSVGYVSTSKSESESEINVAADLTGEVELHFRSEAVQLNRLVGDGAIGQIVANTPVPAANAEAIPWGTSPDARVAPTARRQSARIDAPMRAAPTMMTPPPIPGAPPAGGGAPAGGGGAPGGAARPPAAGSPAAGSPAAPPAAGASPPAAPAAGGAAPAAGAAPRPAPPGGTPPGGTPPGAAATPAGGAPAAGGSAPPAGGTPTPTGGGGGASTGSGAGSAVGSVIGNAIGGQPGSTVGSSIGGAVGGAIGGALATPVDVPVSGAPPPGPLPTAITSTTPR